FLLLSLAVSPLIALGAWGGLMRLRRMIGLFAAAYAAVHLWAWAREYAFDWPFLWDEVTLRLYLTIGFVGALLLLPLAATSLNALHRWLGPHRWRHVHTLISPTTIAAYIHWLLSRRFSRVELLVDGVVLVICVAWRIVGAVRRPAPA